jgi:nicotinamidase-related amidase
MPKVKNSLPLSESRDSRQIGVSSSYEDELRVLMLIIDAQFDFCDPSGTLFVRGRSGYGAAEDSQRTAEFINRNTHRITQIDLSADLHSPFQCFFPVFWRLIDGQVPAAHTLIDLTKDRRLINTALDGTVINYVEPEPLVVPLVNARSYDWLLKQMKFYVRKLRQRGKRTLYLWPFHCLEGSEGQRIVGSIFAAALHHSLSRCTELHFIHKGQHPLTESYSVYLPEVMTLHDGMGCVDPDVYQQIARLDDYDRVIIAGQASSHCVSETVRTIIQRHSTLHRLDQLGKYYLLTDCMSPVVVPGVVDFTQAADEALQGFSAQGMHLVQSTTPIEEWPAFLQ